MTISKIVCSEKLYSLDLKKNRCGTCKIKKYTAVISPEKYGMKLISKWKAQVSDMTFIEEFPNSYRFGGDSVTIFSWFSAVPSGEWHDKFFEIGIDCCGRRW
jgi:hypothetical protein